MGPIGNDHLTEEMQLRSAFTMQEPFSVQSTSNRTASVGDVWIDKPDNESAALTRKIARSELVDNVHSDKARVKLSIIHQRRSKNSPWQDCDTFNLATLKAGQEMKLHLNAAETYHVYKILTQLHTIANAGIPKYDQTLSVVDESVAIVVRGREADLIRQMTEEAPEDFWAALEKIQPNLFRAAALTRLHDIREAAVDEFKKHVEANDWSESDWQNFFQRNTWIFGYGLSYRFLSTITGQPNFGGTKVTGHGGQRGDFFTASEAERRFTVLIEIKKPNSILSHPKLYRNGVHQLGDDLTGGVSQLQANCRTWETEGSRTDGNRELLERDACYTIQPKGILIIGHTKQLNDKATRTTFELFRRNLFNPEVITFDELLERATHLLLNEAKELKTTQMAEGEIPNVEF